MMHDTSPSVITHPNRDLLSSADLRYLLDLGYRFAKAASFSDLAQTAVDVIPPIFGMDCRAAIKEFNADGNFVAAHVSAPHQEICSHKDSGAMASGRTGKGDPLMMLAGLLHWPQMPEQMRDFDSCCDLLHAGLDQETHSLETRHQACQWITASPSGFSILGLNRRKTPFSEREMALIGELRNLLAMNEARIRQMEAAHRYAEAIGKGSPVCGWVEIDTARWRLLRMAGPTEGWLAAMRSPAESLEGVPEVLRKAIEQNLESVTVPCLRIPRQSIEVTAFPGILPGRVMMVLRRSLGETAAPFDRASLTRREREVLSLAGTGSSRGEIALQLGIAKRTVDKHLEQAYAKLGVSGKTEALLKSGI